MADCAKDLPFHPFLPSSPPGRQDQPLPRLFSKGFTYIISCNPHNNLIDRHCYYCLHSNEEETEAEHREAEELGQGNTVTIHS